MFGERNQTQKIIYRITLRRYSGKSGTIWRKKDLISKGLKIGKVTYFLWTE